MLTGLAGLAAGAFSMATGEFVSVSSQNELVEAEVRKEAHELKHNPESERQELAATFRMRGVDPELADEVARQISVHPDDALAVHVREELGVDHEELPSPYTAAGASLVTFAVGALIPLIPYLAGLNSLPLALGLAALAAFIGGGLVARLTDRPFFRGAFRQLLLGAVAAGITYLIGNAVGATPAQPAPLTAQRSPSRADRGYRVVRGAVIAAWRSQPRYGRPISPGRRHQPSGPNESS